MMKDITSHNWSAPFGARVLDAVRYIEAACLLVIGILLVLYYGPLGLVGASFLLGGAVVLLPKTREAVRPTQDAQRLSLLDGLRSEALVLRDLYTSTASMPLSESRSREMWRVRREIIVWLDRSRARMKTLPEFAPIYEDRTGSGGVLYELDCALACLSEMQRLLRLSQKLRLPI